MLIKSLVYFKKNPILIAILIPIVVFLPWLTLRILTASDWGFLYQETMRENLSPSVWLGQNGFGAQDIIFWRTPYNLLMGLFGLFGFNSNIADKILVFWPIIFIIPISSFLLVKKVLRSNIGALVGSIVFTFNTYFLAISTQGHVLINIASGFAVLSLFFFMNALEKKQTKYFVLTSLGLFTTGFYDFRVLYIALTVLGLYFIFYLCFIHNHLNVKELLRKLIIPTAVCLVAFMLMNIYWVIALALSGGLLDNSILERALFGNQFWSLSSALTLFHPFWSDDKLEWFKIQPIPLRFWFVPVFAFLGLYLNRKNKKVLFFGLIALLGILLSKQVSAPFTGFYLLLHETIPGFNAFREASKFYLLIALSYGVLTGAFVDWLWRNWNKNRWQVYGKYVLTILVACLFLWNTKPIISGEIRTLYVPRHIPNDYLILKDFMLKQPEYSRTYWVPRDSRWGIYTNDHPKVSGVDVIQSDWKQFTGDNQQGNDYMVQNQIVDIFKQPYGEDLLSDAGVKYIIVPLQDKENDDDFFVYYGNDRQLYIDTLDKVDFLKRIDIGTKDLVVYENKNYKPHISAQSSLVSVENYSTFSDTYTFIDGVSSLDFSFVNSLRNPYAKNIKDLFATPTINAINGNLNVIDTTTVDDYSQKKLYKNVAANNMSYYVDDEGIEFNLNEAPSFTINKNVELFKPEPTSTLAKVPLNTEQKYLLSLDSATTPIRDTGTTQLGNMNQYNSVRISTEGENLVPNPSFEDGLWQQQVGDCYNYDEKPLIGMSHTFGNRTDGDYSLQLDATKHITCTSIEIPFTELSEAFLSFDYQSLSEAQAGYYIIFNDQAKTVYSERLASETPGEWEAFAKIIAVPEEATTASLSVYAHESDGSTKNTVLYDNFSFSEPQIIKNIELPNVPDSFESIDIALNSGENTFELTSLGLDGKNLITNASFEDALWSDRIGDCNNYDSNGMIGMQRTDNVSIDGNYSLQLEATRHIACTSQNIPISVYGNHLFSFDYYSNNSEQAGYYIIFNDAESTVISERLDIEEKGTWQELRKKIKVPLGATTASLAIYAYETDGRTNNIVNYDNFQLVDIPELDNRFYLLTEPQIDMQSPEQISYSSINPTQKQVNIDSASKPFVLNFAESFHHGWKLYLKPISEASSCDTAHTYNPPVENGESTVVQCQQNQRFAMGSGLGYLGQKPVFDDQHIEINGFANGWVVDPEFIKANYGPEYYTENPDGSINFNLAIYFKPQSYFYIGLIVSGTTFVTCIGYLAWQYKKSRRNAGPKPYHSPNNDETQKELTDA